MKIGSLTKRHSGQSSLLTLSFHFDGSKAVGHVRPASHAQSIRNPFQRHDALPAQSRRDPHLLRIALAPTLQFRLRPVPPAKFLIHNPLGFLLPALPPLPPIMTLPDPLGHLRQQLLAKSFVPKTPTPPEGLVLPRIFPAPPLLHLPLEILPSGFGVFRDSHLPPTADLHVAIPAAFPARPHTTGNCSIDRNAAV